MTAMDDPIVKIISALLPGHVRITAETRLKEDLGFDSLKLISLILEIERQFGITLRDEDLVLERFQTVRSCQALIDRYQGTLVRPETELDARSRCGPLAS